MLKLKIALLCVALILLASTANASEKSVSIGGHTFTADLDDNWVTSVGQIAPYDPKDLPDSYLDYGNAEYWTGTRDFYAFNYGPDLPGENENSDQTGYASLFILKPDTSLRSLKPEGEDESSFLLRAATDIFVMWVPGMAGGPEDESHKDIDFNGRPAHLVEYKDLGTIAFFLDNDTIAVICIYTDNVGMRAWDVLDSITVE